MTDEQITQTVKDILDRVDMLINNGFGVDYFQENLDIKQRQSSRAMGLSVIFGIDKAYTCEAEYELLKHLTNLVEFREKQRDLAINQAIASENKNELMERLGLL